uniref:Uncharacterized protein n=1 Tax=Rhizophora mucronata TaxID=61149 RepID=A0A2P2NNV8_RHIMU
MILSSGIFLPVICTKQRVKGADDRPLERDPNLRDPLQTNP